MKAALYNIYKILRTIIVIGIVSFVTFFVSLYLILLIPSVQSSIRAIAEDELSGLLQTKVSIGSLSIEPFTQVVLNDVVVPDKNGKDLLKIDKLGAGLSLYNLAVRKRVVFTYAELIGLNGEIYRETPDSPANIQFLVDALSSKDKNKPPTKFDLAIYNIVLRKSSIAYDVLNQDSVIGRFDKNHIRINDLRADIALPKLKNDDYSIEVRRLSFEELSGFELKNLTINALVTKESLAVSNLKIELPGSYVSPEDFTLDYGDIKLLSSKIKETNIGINISDSYVTLKDLSSFVPAFSKFVEPIHIKTVLSGTISDFEIPMLDLLTGDGRISVKINGAVNSIDDNDNLNVDISHININAKADEVAKFTSLFTNLSVQAKDLISQCGNVDIDGSVLGTADKFDFSGVVATSLGNVVVDGKFKNGNNGLGFKGVVSTDNFNLGMLLNKQDLLNELAFNLDLDGSYKQSGIEALIKGEIPYLDLKGYRYKNINANVSVDGNEYAGTLLVDDENMAISTDGMIKLDGKNTHLDFNMNVGHVNLANLNLEHKYPSHNMSFKMYALMSGNQLTNLNGTASVNDFKFVDNQGKGISISNFELFADNSVMPSEINIASDVVNGSIIGMYDFNYIVPAVKHIIGRALPSLFVVDSRNSGSRKLLNDFDYSFRIEASDATNNVLSFFNMPIGLLYPITLSGHLKEEDNTFNAVIDAPYIEQKNKLIEASRIEMLVDSVDKNVEFNLQTLMPVKNGKMALQINGNGVNNRLDTDISWKVDRKENYHGKINMSTSLARVNETNSLMATINVNPTNMVFNDTVWDVHESKIGIYNKNIRVDGFKVTCDKQYVAIDGRTSANSGDKLTVSLNDVNLGYIFQTLELNNVAFGGHATGTVYASDLLSGAPNLKTDGFYVKEMSYNETLLGDADITSYWNNDKKFIGIKALVSQPNGCKTNVDGEIYPMNDSLRFDFEADKLKVGFMKPFMSAITSDLDGYASGNACLYGKFKTLNLYGDIFVEDLKVKVDYTNVYYWATDSIKIIPGLIDFKDVELKDRYGHTANLTGWVRHEDFHNASFDFQVTKAKDLLCYDIPEKQIDNWYGSIFGNGSAFVSGEPGVVRIDVNMETAANSKFYFELSDAEAAMEYDFITFTDKRKAKQEAENKVQESLRDQILRKYEKKKKEENSKGSRVLINLQADVNPLGQMILVMDPAGGDKIKATGSGNLTMKYDSREELEMFGKYTLEQGTYNFTLQDIIIKDFTIKEGSSIAFDGDPFAAVIDISAVYALNANLQDLDEQFATDKELNRTNVPVHALLNVSGYMLQPAIGFDLEFPTLSSDAYRKVKSIISTDDMMNRQIIYLLALNRFYTPEYMGNTNKNNELASVASSTISSQLSSMLGQISDKWSISPNFKSDKGDFSDVEVNLALSSRLLNNRLIFNGNFGYRDKMMNDENTNLIGDFDLEYLLNKAGNVRLKGYNHFNDQNYYVKNALTTQGFGVEFKYDFNNLFDFMRKRKETKIEQDTIEVKNRVD